MKILVTGAKGFVGKNLVARLKSLNCHEIYEYDLDSPIDVFDDYCKNADFIYNLAGVNRPQNVEEFMIGNRDFGDRLIDVVEFYGNKCPIVLSSSIQAGLDNPYGISKKAGEDLFFQHAKKTGSKAYIYRFPNIFGKWCRPNYNSAVATFCHNIANDLPITINDPKTLVTLVYIDDVVDELLRALNKKPTKAGEFCCVPKVYRKSLQEITDLLYFFKNSRTNLLIADMADDFAKALYATYLSYLPKDKFSYPLKMNVDNRGSFTEILRTAERGQVSVNVAKPGITKGNHWHNTKNEKFLVVSGKGVIRFRKYNDDEVIEYFVSGEKMEVVDIPPGYTHNIENLGDTDLVTIMWCNECFDPDRPDTYFLEV